MGKIFIDEKITKILRYIAHIYKKTFSYNFIIIYIYHEAFDNCFIIKSQKIQNHWWRRPTRNHKAIRRIYFLSAENYHNKFSQFFNINFNVSFSYVIFFFNMIFLLYLFCLIFHQIGIDKKPYFQTQKPYSKLIIELKI